jgi:hypothetical protein
MAFSMDYRRSAEYEQLMGMLKSDYPHTPEYVLEYAVMAHKQFPNAYKNEYKERKQGKQVKKVFTPDECCINGVEVCDDVQLPEITKVEK